MNMLIDQCSLDIILEAKDATLLNKQMTTVKKKQTNKWQLYIAHYYNLLEKEQTFCK